MRGDYDDLEDTTGSTKQAGDTRLHATISVDGAVTTKLLPSTGELSIGRGAGCELVVNHASVSRRHATLRLSPLEIIDEGSRNGTRLEGERLVPGVATSLEVGDVIVMGDAAIVLQAVPVSESSLPAANEPTPGSPIDVAIARSARTRSPFALLYVATQARASDVLPTLRSIMRTTDVIKGDGSGGYQILLLDTGPDQAAQAQTRLSQMLARQKIAASIGIARYPEDGVVAEQLIAHALIGDSASAMAPVHELVQQVATGELSVLVTGETGVGKELCAETIHRLSPRASMPFVRFNCSALVETLVESELFGHERGAFTGATSAHPGLLEAANSGTVFLDEVGELSLAVQAKLLRVLEERVVRRVGSNVGRKIDVRFVCATNRDLIEEVNAGRFRRDLYYRINGVRIVIPPLRERREEIVPLARAFAARARPGVSAMMGADTIAALQSHPWPGNIRELRNTIERAVLTSSGGAIRPSHLVLEHTAQPPPAAWRESNTTIPIERISYETIVPSRSSGSLANDIAELEKKRIIETLDKYGGNQTHAARALGMSRTTLIARMEEYSLRRPRKRD